MPEGDFVSTDKLADQARAKIIWGHSPQEVLTWLKTQKVESDVAQNVVQDAMAEMRKSKVRKLIVGLFIIVVPVVFLLFLPKASTRLEFGLHSILGFIAIFGAARTISGLVSLFRGSRA